MPAELVDHVVVVTGATDADDASTAGEWLFSGSSSQVDLAGCTHLHGAMLQVLLQARPTLVALPRDPRLVQLLAGVPAHGS